MTLLLNAYHLITSPSCEKDEKLIVVYYGNPGGMKIHSVIARDF